MSVRSESSLQLDILIHTLTPHGGLREFDSFFVKKGGASLFFLHSACLGDQSRELIDRITDKVRDKDY